MAWRGDLELKLLITVTRLPISRPSYEDFSSENAQLQELVKTLSARQDRLERENAELRRRLGQDLAEFVEAGVGAMRNSL